MRKFVSLESSARVTELAIDEAGSESMEASLVETVDLASDIDSGIKTIEETIKDADQLNKHIELLINAEESGGASTGVVEVTKIATEGIFNKLNIIDRSVTPAFESFGSSSNKLSATRELRFGLENILTTIWDAVVNAIKKLIEYIKSFFEWVFGTKDKVSVRIEKLEEKQKQIESSPNSKASSTTSSAQDTTNDAQDTKTVKGNGISNVLMISSFADFDKNGGASFVEIAKQSDKYIGDKKAKIAEIEKVISDSSAFDRFTFEAGKGNKVDRQSSGDLAWFTLLENGAFTLTELLPIKQKVGEDAFEAAGKYQVRETRKEHTATDLPILTNDEIKKALEASKHLNALGENANVVKKETEDFLNSSLKSIDKLIDYINKELKLKGKEEGDFKRMGGVVKKAVSQIVLQSAKISIIPLKESTRQAIALTTYVERSQDAIK